MEQTKKATKTDRIMYWVFTSIFVLFDGVGALGFNTKLAVDGLHHMGFPDYFRWELGIGKIVGGALLIFPFVPARLKEWAYVGFGIATISAFIGHIALGDQPAEIMMPVVIFAILVTSYVYYHRLRKSGRKEG